MQDKPLDHTEQALLDLIRQLHDEGGPFLRNRLTVVGRGKGLEVARPLGRLKSLGLVEEFEQRPSWIRWLWGARKRVLLRPVLPAEPVVPAPAPLPEIAPESLAESLPETLPEAAAEVAAPLTEAPVEPTLAPVAAPQPEPVPAPRQAPRAVPQGYAEDFGGAPVAPQPVALAAGLDPELLEGLRDMLAILGMEMTMAGESLTAARLAQGASPGEALMQVVVFAFAHAARFDMASANPAPAEDLQEYAVAVLNELGRLRDAGEIDPAVFENDQRAILSLADPAGDRGPQVEALFSDPIGGAAPPALLPEELRGIEEDVE